MRRVFLAAVTLVTSLATLFAAAAGPATAEPARTSDAAGSGLTATGLVPIAATPVAGPVVQPPDKDTGLLSTVAVPVAPIAVNGTLNAQAVATQADALTPLLVAGPRLNGAVAKPVGLTGVSARGFGGAQSVGVVVSAAAGIPAAFILPSASLVKADAIEAEAVAKCVNNQPVFDYGVNIANLSLAGSPVTLVNQLVGNVVNNVLGANNPLAGLIAFSTPLNDPSTVVRTANGISVDALRITLLGALGGTPLETIVIGHAEASMPPGCGVAVAKPPTGPGPVAPVATRLASTGSDVPFLPLGLALVGAAVLGGGIVRRSRRAAATH